MAEAVAGALAAADVNCRGSAWDRLTERLSAFNVKISLAGVVSVSTDLSTAATPSRTTQDMFRSLVATRKLRRAGR